MIRLTLLLMLIHFSAHAITVTSGITSISGTGTHVNPELAVSPAGRAVAVWTEAFPNRVEAAYFNGAAWQTPVIIANGSFPQVAIDLNGNAITVWLDTSTNQIFSSRLNAVTGTWSPPLQLSTSGINAAPQIAVNLNGNALAIWVLSTPFIQILGSSFNVTTMTWSTPQVLVSGTGSFPQVGLDNFDNGIVMWIDTQFGVETVTVSIP